MPPPAARSRSDSHTGPVGRRSGQVLFPMKIRGILLAAGSSSRFGANKLLHPLPEGTNAGTDAGTPIAVASARHLVTALPHPIAVVRPGAAELEAALRNAGCEVV